MDKEVKREIKVSGKGKSATSFPLAAITRPFEDMERRFEQMFNRGWMRPFPERNLWREMLEPLNRFEQFEMRWPSVDLVDRDNEIVVRAEIPGVVKKDLDVSMSDNMLTIKGQMKHEEKEEKGEYFHSEICQGSFSRCVYLPVGVDTSKISASLKDGVLEVTLRKLESSVRLPIKVQ